MPARIPVEDTKTCTKCGETKDSSLFWRGKAPRKDGTYGLRSYCIDCGTKRRLEYYHNQGGKAKQQQRSFKYNLSRYGITKTDYDYLLNKQNKKCAICGATEVLRKDKRNDSLYVDHCHSTGKIRGLLCNNCNSGLGMFKDKIENLKAAIEYLNENSSRH